MPFSLEGITYISPGNINWGSLYGPVTHRVITFCRSASSNLAASGAQNYTDGKKSLTTITRRYFRLDVDVKNYHETLRFLMGIFSTQILPICHTCLPNNPKVILHHINDILNKYISFTIVVWKLWPDMCVWSLWDWGTKSMFLLIVKKLPHYYW